jgi:hypothetical protein
MAYSRSSLFFTLHLTVSALLVAPTHLHAQEQAESVLFHVDPSNGSYSLSVKGLAAPILHADVAAKVDGRWIKCSGYPEFAIHETTTPTVFGVGKGWDVRCSGLPNQPDISYQVLASPHEPFGEIHATVHNTTRKPIHVEAIRVIEALGSSILNLGGPTEQDRVLSDSFSEDVPPIKIRDLKDSENSMHRGVGSQLIYNQKSRWSFFAGALTTDHFLTLLRLHTDKNSMITAFEADSTGTTEITRENSLLESPMQDQIPLSITVLPNAELNSERLVVSAGTDYHHQLETYANMVKQLHHARTTAPPVLGWWSWTAYYYGLNEGAALTNAQWLAQNLSSLGFTMFHLDEGYQYARGEYTTPDAALFPHGMIPFERQVGRLGLTRGIWTAPFEVSERSNIYLKHPEWLVRNANNQPIHLGWANNHHDRLYALDTTHPAAQEYLRETYTTLVKDWGIHYIKLDFMDDSAVEGVRYRQGTTALEAQRIGLDVIRHAVGDDVMLDKDGSTMLNPVGYVDYGRTGQDTGHTFTATKEAAPAIAARYYMNRTFFVNDPDAFTVSAQTVKDHPWNGGKVPLTLEEAKVSIAVSAIAGGMFEIGDDLPTLGGSPERLALVKNRDLLDMVRLGRASRPMDLMTFRTEDEQPSVFFLREDKRQSIITVFNWTDKPSSHTLDLSSLGLAVNTVYTASEVMGLSRRSIRSTLSISQPAHSVRMFKLEDTRVLRQQLKLEIEHPSQIKTGENARFSIHPKNDATAVIGYRWDFGDGTSATGSDATHTYTQPGTYKVAVEAIGLNGKVTRQNFDLLSTGSISTVFVPEAKQRLQP